MDDSGTVMGAFGAVSRLDAWMLSRRYDKTPPALPRPARSVDNHGMHQGVTAEARPQHLPRLRAHTTGPASLYPERASQINAMPAPPVRPRRTVPQPTAWAAAEVPNAGFAPRQA